MPVAGLPGRMYEEGSGFLGRGLRRRPRPRKADARHAISLAFAQGVAGTPHAANPASFAVAPNRAAVAFTGDESSGSIEPDT